MAKLATRPRSVALFAKFYLASIVLSVGNVMLNYGPLRAYSVQRGSAAGVHILAVIWSLLAGWIFWYFIARRGSNLAKWLLVTISALDLLQIPAAITFSSVIGWHYGVVFTASGVALLAALIMLFRPDAIKWLTDRNNSKPIDPAAFR